MTGETAAKACCKCGVDVSQAKRHKDGKGRYWCEACFAKAAATKDKGPASAATTKPAVAEATPSWLAGSLAIEGKRCTVCTAPMPKDGVICTSCGHNSETGKSVSTRVLAAPKEKEPKSAGAGLDPTMYAYGYGLVCIGLLVGGTMNSACGIAFLAVVSIGSLGIGIWLLVTMAMQSVVKAVLGFLCGLYALYWVLTQCDNQLLRTFVLVSVVIAILSALAQTGIIPVKGLESLGLQQASALSDTLGNAQVPVISA